MLLDLLEDARRAAADAELDQARRIAALADALCHRRDSLVACHAAQSMTGSTISPVEPSVSP